MNSRTSFLSDLNGHRASTADFIQYCQRGELTVSDRAVMLERAKTLAETAVVHGYKHITDTAYALEKALLIDTQHEELVRLARAFFDACHEALVILPSARLVQPPTTARRFFGHNEKPRLLTADDDRGVRAIITTLFSRYAHIIEAENGLAALDAIRLYRPDVVILDDTMPAVNGLTILDTLHADPELNDTCVVMLTSTDGQREVARAFEAGVVDYITKPFDPMVLSEKVMAMLARVKKSA